MLVFIHTIYTMPQFQVLAQINIETSHHEVDQEEQAYFFVNNPKRLQSRSSIRMFLLQLSVDSKQTHTFLNVLSQGKMGLSDQQDLQVILLYKMSLSVCSITGQPLKNPMASLKTGHLYEKEVIQKHLNAFPYCPITNQPMSSSDLIEVAPLKEILLRQDESPMTYFSKIQHEFNVLAVDAFKLRKNLKETEEELTHTLYQNEAAQRVIAKLLKQKEDAENQIEKLEARLKELSS